jgi:hypothetical protein
MPMAGSGAEVWIDKARKSALSNFTTTTASLNHVFSTVTHSGRPLRALPKSRTDPSNPPRPAWCAPHPQSYRSSPFLTKSDPGCNAICQYNRAHPPKPHPPGTISYIDWAPSTETCSGNVCSSNDNGVPLIQLEGQGFGPNTYAQFVVYSRSNGAQLFSGLAPVGNLGYTAIQTNLRDCSSYPDAAKNNAYAKAYDARASAWGKEIDLSTGCTDTIL